MGNANHKQEAQDYLEGYSKLPQDPNASDNARFYNNEIPCRPDGLKIDDLHKQWYREYKILEDKHNYIQWLFPLQPNTGVNPHAQRLMHHEKKEIAERNKERVLRSYEMMLDFYGMNLVDHASGKVTRGKNWKEQYRNLLRYSHNNLRITRILKFLGEVDLEYLKYPFLDHVLEEIHETEELLPLNNSCMDYWFPVLRNREEKEKLRMRWRLPESDDEDDNSNNKNDIEIDDDDDDNWEDDHTNYGEQASNTPTLVLPQDSCDLDLTTGSIVSNVGYTENSDSAEDKSKPIVDGPCNRNTDVITQNVDGLLTKPKE